jgi:hypothetical protein
MSDDQEKPQKLTREQKRAKNKADHAERRKRGQKLAEGLISTNFNDERDPVTGMHKGGRGLEVITPEMATEIIDMIADMHFIKDIAETMKISKRAIRQKVFRDPMFREQYYMARQMQAEFLVERIIMIALGKDDLVKDVDFETRKLVLDSVKWLASKILAKIYGDKNAPISLSGMPGAVVQVTAKIIDVELPDEVEDALLEALEGVEYEVQEK